MSKGPDLSAFPIPRKGGAKPIAADEANEAADRAEEHLGKGKKESVVQRPPPVTLPKEPSSRQSSVTEILQREATRLSGQTVATTVKLDEDRYLRLADAGKPGPGRLKRRTFQEMVIEALDEWLERRGI